jgi:hypothetical protein
VVIVLYLPHSVVRSLHLITSACCIIFVYANTQPPLLWYYLFLLITPVYCTLFVYVNTRPHSIVILLHLITSGCCTLPAACHLFTALHCSLVTLFRMTVVVL